MSHMTKFLKDGTCMLVILLGSMMHVVETAGIYVGSHNFISSTYMLSFVHAHRE